MNMPLEDESFDVAQLREFAFEVTFRQMACERARNAEPQPPDLPPPIAAQSRSGTRCDQCLSPALLAVSRR